MKPLEKVHKLSALPLTKVRIKDNFWSPKLKRFREVTLIDSFTKFENDRGGAFDNYDRVVRGDSGYHAGPEWYDGLVNEMIRAAADFLAVQYDADLDKRLDGYIERIARAAAKDSGGYINTWTQLMAPNHRWGFNGGFLRGQHDVYNAGALVEAAVHHYQATGKVTHLNTAVKFANHMCDIIGPPPKKNVVPAHSLPEEAVVKLYLLFRDNPSLKKKVAHPVEEQRYLKLSEFWLENRGNHAGGPDWENDDHDTCLKYIRNCEYGDSRPTWGSYAQDHKSIFEQETLEGHSVRATLMCTGLITTAMVNDRQEYYAAALRLWENMVHKRMHLTGGVGAFHKDEKFGPDYFLPNNAYLETCAAVGAAFFHREMGLAFGDARYVDELERALYNNILNGVSHSGDHYFYQNPLEGHSCSRWEWHVCPCCPPMFLKIMSALPGYIYARDEEGLYVNLFIGSEADFELKGNGIRLTQKTHYPWDGRISITVSPERTRQFPLYLRVPGWVRGSENPGGLYRSKANSNEEVVLRVNRKKIPLEIERGYARVERRWRAGDQVTLDIPLPIRRVYAHPEVEADRGKVALLRGPLVYCLESIDQPTGISSYALKPDDVLKAQFRPGFLDGATVITGGAWLRDKDSQQHRPTTITAIPFYTQCNRDYYTQLLTWLPEIV